MHFFIMNNNENIYMAQQAIYSSPCKYGPGVLVCPPGFAWYLSCIYPVFILYLQPVSDFCLIPAFTQHSPIYLSVLPSDTELHLAVVYFTALHSFVLRKYEQHRSVLHSLELHISVCNSFFT